MTKYNSKDCHVGDRFVVLLFLLYSHYEFFDCYLVTSDAKILASVFCAVPDMFQ